MEHGLQCLARFIRALLGASAVHEDKMACGVQLCILGVYLFSQGIQIHDYMCMRHCLQAG